MSIIDEIQRISSATSDTKDAIMSMFPGLDKVYSADNINAIKNMPLDEFYAEFGNILNDLCAMVSIDASPTSQQLLPDSSVTLGLLHAGTTFRLLSDSVSYIILTPEGKTVDFIYGFVLLLVGREYMRNVHRTTVTSYIVDTLPDTPIRSTINDEIFALNLHIYVERDTGYAYIYLNESDGLVNLSMLAFGSVVDHGWGDPDVIISNGGVTTNTLITKAHDETSVRMIYIDPRYGGIDSYAYSTCDERKVQDIAEVYCDAMDVYYPYWFFEKYADYGPRSDGSFELRTFNDLDASSPKNLIIPAFIKHIGPEDENIFYTAIISCESITIHSGVRSIEKYALSDVGLGTHLTINYKGTKQQWKAISFGENWWPSVGTYSIVCTDGTIAADGTET